MSKAKQNVIFSTEDVILLKFNWSIILGYPKTIISEFHSRIRTNQKLGYKIKPEIAETYTGVD